MLYDEKAYKLLHRGCTDVTERSDASQLNALQFKHSSNAVYFGCSQSLEYVRDLWLSHGRNARRPVVETRELRDVEIDGRTESVGMTQILEPHLDIRVDLSFVPCDPMPDSGKFPGYRDADLMKEYKARTIKTEDTADEPGD